jgi:hypothetical protein
MSLFFDRSRRAGHYLEWKVRFFTVGATLAIGGMLLDKRWVVGVAIVILAAGMLLRFLPTGEEPDDGSSAEEEEGDEDPPENGNDAAERQGRQPE